MKKTVLIEVLLLFCFTMLFIEAIRYWHHIDLLMRSIKFYTDSRYEIYELEELYAYVYDALPYAIFFLMAAIANIAAMVLIALHDIPKLKAWVDKRKAARAAAKAEKAEADKQARIEQLTAELEQLKKDE